MSECYNSVMEQKVFGNIMLVLCLHTKQLYKYGGQHRYNNYSLFTIQYSLNKIKMPDCGVGHFVCDYMIFDYLSLLKSIRSFSSFEPLAFSNISRRCSTVRFFFSSPEISRIILPSLIIIRRLP